MAHRFSTEVHPPEKPDKGKFGGSCNVRRCQAPGARNCHMDNHAGLKFYCDDCARDINRASWRFDGFEIIRPSDGEYPFPNNYYMIESDRVKKERLDAQKARDEASQKGWR